MSYGLRKNGDIFHDKESALDMAYSLLYLAESLAKQHGFSFLAAIQPNEDWIGNFHHFSENTGSELKAAWYELSGKDE